MDNGKLKIVYNITERNGRSFWNRVGAAFTNRDGSLSVRLDALPLTGELHIREYSPKEEGLEQESRHLGSVSNLAQSA